MRTPKKTNHAKQHSHYDAWVRGQVTQLNQFVILSSSGSEVSTTALNLFTTSSSFLRRMIVSEAATVNL